jgi:predicted metal-dependent phosphoesterase TrpH
VYKIDLHTHSVASPDGGLTPDDYRQMLASGELDYAAVTDHGRIDFALELQRELGTKIIVGEEIKTTEGELVGLFLQKPVPDGKTPAATAKLIHDQGGLVYVPHPFERVRSGLPRASLDKLVPHVDIVETYNGRALFQNKSRQAYAWAAEHNLPGASSSDAHGPHGWGRTYSLVSEVPTAENLCCLLCCGQQADYSLGLRAALYPKLNRLKKKVRHA